MDTRTGLDACILDDFKRFHGKTIGVVCHQASIGRDCVHILDHLLPLHESGKLKIAAAFGPQHGIWGHTQDNMIEWEGYVDARTGLKFYSLYGEHREPSPEMLAGIEELVFDVQDVGARYYTFIWTLAYCMEACQKLGIKVTILDRPNPIGGAIVEGPGHDMAFQSFVGRYSLPVRHGLTMGEVATFLASAQFPKVDLEVVHLERWKRHWLYDHTGLPWGMPSPNMPTLDTAIVYPGQCLLEGTKISEGRGTTRPFEIFGAPYIDAWTFSDRLNELGLSGVTFRPYVFMPTFQKFHGEVCEGAFLHVTDRSDFRPVLTTLAILRTLLEMYPTEFGWQDPPYEYEFVKLPIDILLGSDRWRLALERGDPLSTLRDAIDEEADVFAGDRARAAFYQ